MNRVPVSKCDDANDESRTLKVITYIQRAGTMHDDTSERETTDARGCDHAMSAPFSAAAFSASSSLRMMRSGHGENLDFMRTHVPYL